MKLKNVLPILSLILFISFISATTTTLSTSQTNFNLHPSDTGTFSVSYSITDTSGNGGDKPILFIGSPSFLSSTTSGLSYGGNTTTTGNFVVNYNIPSSQSTGVFQQTVLVDTFLLNLNFNITNPTQTPPPTSSCSVNIFPLSLTNVKVQQGETKTRNIQLNIPECFDDGFRVVGVTLATDEQPIQLGELSTGVVNPGQTINIPIEMDAEGVSTGQYSDTLQFLIQRINGSNYNVPPVNIGVLVTSGVSPITNFSFSDLPSCSLNANELGTNQTYTMTCTRNNPNIEIHSNIDSFYLQGVSVTETSTQYVYNFKALNIGTTKFKADFLYKGAPIGPPFEKEIKISPSGNAPTGSVNLDFDFYQNGVNKSMSSLSAGDLIINVVDKQTRSIVIATLYLNGLQINNSFNLEMDKDYILRATSPGYLDRVETLKVTNLPIPFSISPDKSSYYEGDVITITANVSNASIKVNGQETSSYSLLTGNNTLNISAPGYISANKIIFALNKPTIITMSAESSKWKKGDAVSLKLSEPINWSVSYVGEGLAPTTLASGNGDLVNFNAQGSGSYVIESNGNQIYSTQVNKSKFGDWMKSNWYWVLIALAVLIGVLYFLNSSGSDEVLSQDVSWGQ